MTDDDYNNNDNNNIKRMIIIIFFVGHDLVKLVRDDARSINSDPSGKLMNLFHVYSFLFDFFLSLICVFYTLALICTMCIIFLIN
jgi:hypothetical protein